MTSCSRRQRTPPWEPQISNSNVCPIINLYMWPVEYRSQSNSQNNKWYEFWGSHNGDYKFLGTMKIEAAHSSETPVTIYQTTRPHIPKVIELLQWNPPDTYTSQSYKRSPLGRETLKIVYDAVVSQFCISDIVWFNFTFCIIYWGEYAETLLHFAGST
jgi:hypothetical protein